MLKSVARKSSWLLSPSQFFLLLYNWIWNQLTYQFIETLFCTDLIKEHNSITTLNVHLLFVLILWPKALEAFEMMRHLAVVYLLGRVSVFFTSVSQYKAIFFSQVFQKVFVYLLHILDAVAIYKKLPSYSKLSQRNNVWLASSKKHDSRIW
jgi:hypothetical protein